MTTTKNLKQHNPPHPGKIIKNIYIVEIGMDIDGIAIKTGLEHTIVSALIDEEISVTNEIASKLERLGRSKESWIAMQKNFNEFQKHTVTNPSR